ncbi:AAA family ATPase [Streptomyces sp. NPDC058086]|uniref:AAA family ATPase n=1 Tax=Streptomyces sp. NPDC058086 TaxID=3346334 RepID=UPI0036F0A9FB
MVVIDVFAKMRGQAPQGVSAYDADYVSVGYAKRLADHYGIAVVLVHHVRKPDSDDFLTEVSGTNGVAHRRLLHRLVGPQPRAAPGGVLRGPVLRGPQAR